MALPISAAPTALVGAKKPLPRVGYTKIWPREQIFGMKQWSAGDVFSGQCLSTHLSDGHTPELCRYLMVPFKRFKLPILFLLLAEILLLLLFPPSLIFEPNLTAGGDTPAHFLSAMAMRNRLLAPLSPVTWIHGAYAGFPLFLNYFPLPFMLMALISLAVSLLVAFKLVTLLAIIPLPLAVYYCLRRLGYREWTPALGAVLSLLFLFMTDNTMWGGNIFSTLAGEFAFGISFILYIVYIGKLYSDLPGRKSLFTNSLIEALIALSHGYPLLQAGMGTTFFILRGRNLRYVLLLHAAAFGLAGFWLVPLLLRTPWDTSFVLAWSFKSWSEIAPPILLPAFAGALVCLAESIRSILREWGQRKSPPGSSPGQALPPFTKGGEASLPTDHCSPLTGHRSPPTDHCSPLTAHCSLLTDYCPPTPEYYLWWQFLMALLGFALASSFGLADIRFLPFAQICVVMLGAIGWGRVLGRLPRPNLWSAAFCVGVIALALTRAATLDAWIQWNYSGVESKPLWKSFRMVNQYLAGDQNSPRVVDEHNDITNSAGSIRAFEMLPYLSGRSTLEGLYMQSSPTAPFVFYIQSELTQVPSCPFSAYYYSRQDPERAAAHLRLFNVSQVIAASADISNQLDSSRQYELEMSFPPYRIYRLTNAADSYVEPLKFRPFRIPSSGWKAAQFEWFRKSSLQVPLIVANNGSPGDYWKSLTILSVPPENIPEIPISDPNAEDTHAEAVLGEGTITVTTSHPGIPLWLKISYHPDWKITEGQAEIYLASPAFMLLVPKSPRIVLSFDTRSGIYLWAKVLTLLTLATFARLYIKSRHGKPCRTPVSGGRPEARNQRGPFIPVKFRFLAAGTLIAAVVMISLYSRNHRDPDLLYNYAHNKFERANEKEQGPAPGQPAVKIPVDPADSDYLSTLFDECITKFGHSSVLDHCAYYKASLLAGAGRWSEVRQFMDEFLNANPDTRIYREGTVFLGEACLGMGDREAAELYFSKTVQCWPENDMTRRAGLRLAEINGADSLLDNAQGLLASGEYLRAYVMLRALYFHTDAKIRQRSTLSLAYCCFYMNRWEEASNLFLQWLNDNFDSPESIKVQAALLRCKTEIEQDKLWQGGSPPGASATPSTGWLLRLFKR